MAKGNPKPTCKFPKGTSGNPSGKGYAEHMQWAAMLRLALSEKTEDGRSKLRAVADRCVKAAMDGDTTAIKEIGDRLDGKPKQTIDVDATVSTHEERLSRLGFLGQLAMEEDGEQPGGTRH